MTKAEDYDYLFNNGIAVTTVDGVDDVEEFNDVRKALSTVGVGPDLQLSMWTMIAGLIHLGNVRFKEKAGSAGAGEAYLQDEPLAKFAGELLGAPLLPTKLVRRLMKVKGRSSSYEVNLTEKQAMVARDALAKTVYERLFTWLISKCNGILSSRAYSSAFIGILDIFGFEIFEINSFEQLCINYANEKLQNLFNHHIFVMEQAAYAADGVDVAAIEFINNQPCVDLIEKKPHGLLSLLDEICFLGRETTDKEYLDKIDKAHKGINKFYGGNPKKRSTDRFSVLHFAGEVNYCVDGFIDKNNDTLYTDLEELMTGSKFELMRMIFDDAAMGDAHAESSSTPSTPMPGGGDDSGHASPSVKAVAKTAAKGKTQSVSTIASKFKTQLGALNDTLMATSPHYVRCVKPNKLKRPHTFDHEMILTQLLYSGVLETVRIRRQGFPFRETYLEFWRRACRVGFTCLVPAALALPKPPPAEYKPGPDGKLVDGSATADVVAAAQKACILLCTSLLDSKLWTKGRTKIFLKDGAYDGIIKRFRNFHTLRIQAWWKMALIRKRFTRLRAAVRVLQKIWKGVMMRKKFAAVSKQIAKIQAHMRRKRAQRKYQRMKAVRANAGHKILATIRMHRTRKAFKKFHAAWEKMQGRMRILRAQRELKKRRAAMLAVQAAARTFLAVVRYRRAKKLKLKGASMIQSAWRMYSQRKTYKAIRRSIVKAQRVARAWLAKILRKKMLMLVVVMQAMFKKWKARAQFRKKREAVRKIQSWYRTACARRRYLAIKVAVRRIERATFAHVTGRALTHWVRRLHAACAWGDAPEIDTVLMCRLPEHSRVKHIPVAQRINIRNRMDGFKTALHSAAVSGSVPAVQLLVSRGANPWLTDSMHCTALHKAAAMGDAAAPVLAYLLSLAGGQPHTANAANAINIGGETVLDSAVLAARASGKRGHDEVVKMLLAAGGVPRVCGATVQQIQAALARPKPTMDSMAAAAAAAAAREREAAERRARERRADPHYKLLFVAEQERERAKAKEAARAAQEQSLKVELQQSGLLDSMERSQSEAAAYGLASSLPSAGGATFGAGPASMAWAVSSLSYPLPATTASGSPTRLFGPLSNSTLTNSAAAVYAHGLGAGVSMTASTGLQYSSPLQAGNRAGPYDSAAAYLAATGTTSSSPAPSAAAYAGSSLGNLPLTAQLAGVAAGPQGSSSTRPLAEQFAELQAQHTMQARRAIPSLGLPEAPSAQAAAAPVGGGGPGSAASEGTGSSGLSASQLRGPPQGWQAQAPPHYASSVAAAQASYSSRIDGIIAAAARNVADANAVQGAAAAAAGPAQTSASASTAAVLASSASAPPAAPPSVPSTGSSQPVRVSTPTPPARMSSEAQSVQPADEHSAPVTAQAAQSNRWSTSKRDLMAPLLLSKGITVEEEPGSSLPHASTAVFATGIVSLGVSSPSASPSPFGRGSGTYSPQSSPVYTVGGPGGEPSPSFSGYAASASDVQPLDHSVSPVPVRAGAASRRRPGGHGDDPKELPSPHASYPGGATSSRSSSRNPAIPASVATSGGGVLSGMTSAGRTLLARAPSFVAGPAPTSTGVSSRALANAAISPPKMAMGPVVAASSSKGLAAVRARAMASDAAQQGDASRGSARSTSVEPGNKRSSSVIAAARSPVSSMQSGTARWAASAAAAAVSPSPTKSGTVASGSAGRSTSTGRMPSAAPINTSGRKQGSPGFSSQGSGLSHLLSPAAAALLSTAAPSSLLPGGTGSVQTAGGSRAAYGSGVYSPTAAEQAAVAAAMLGSSSSDDGAQAHGGGAAGVATSTSPGYRGTGGSTPIWQVCQSSSTGLYYYYNTRSGVSQWSQPVDWDGVYAPGQAEAILRSHALSSSGASGQSTSQGRNSSAGAAGMLNSPLSYNSSGTTVHQHQHPAPTAVPAPLGGSMSALKALSSSEPPSAFALPASSVRLASLQGKGGTAPPVTVAAGGSGLGRLAYVR